VTSGCDNVSCIAPKLWFAGSKLLPKRPKS
jgi:hypothetical protein